MDSCDDISNIVILPALIAVGLKNVECCLESLQLIFSLLCSSTLRLCTCRPAVSENLLASENGHLSPGAHGNLFTLKLTRAEKERHYLPPPPSFLFTIELRGCSSLYSDHGFFIVVFLIIILFSPWLKNHSSKECSQWDKCSQNEQVHFAQLRWICDFLLVWQSVYSQNKKWLGICSQSCSLGKDFIKLTKVCSEVICCVGGFFFQAPDWLYQHTWFLLQIHIGIGPNPHIW